MVPLRPTYTLSLRGCYRLPSCDVPAAECRFARLGRERSDALRTDFPDVPRYEHQHGDAAVQDAGRRYGQRETEGKGLLYPEVPLQCRVCRAGYIFPFLFTFLGIKNVAEKGVIPDSVIWSFYIGAAILILCVIYTTMKVKEWNPQQYAEYNEAKSEEGGVKNPNAEAPEDKASWITLLRNAPSTFWKVGLVQFFCWAGFLYLWNYSTGAIAETVWNTTDPASEAFQEAGNWVGILFAVQAVGSVLWAVVLPQFKNTKMAYAVSLIIGGVGLLSGQLLHDQFLQSYHS